MNIFMRNGSLDAGEKDNCLEYSFQVPAQFQALHFKRVGWSVRVCVCERHCVFLTMTESALRVVYEWQREGMPPPPCA